MEFQEWTKVLKQIYEDKGFAEPDFTWETWHYPFEDGLSPQDAFDEDMSYADSAVGRKESTHLEEE